MRYEFSLMALLAVTSCAWQAQDSTSSTASLQQTTYNQSYAVVVEEATYSDPEWREVVDELVKKHSGQCVIYKKTVESSLARLQDIFPKYIAFVVKPEESGCEFIVGTNRLVRKLDDDMYADAMHGIITGYSAKDALRLALATQPQVASTALLTAGIGPERFKEAYFISDGERGVHGHKLPSGVVEKANATGDTTRIFIDYLSKQDPDVIITSGHASQRNLELPFSMGNMVCKNGALWGLSERQVLIDYLTGQSKNKQISDDKLIPIPKSEKPKVMFAMGNCLIGEIPDRNCMALALMSHLNATQFIGYTYTTWYGGFGGLALRYWEQGGGYTALNEGYFFAGQILMTRLDALSPKLARLGYPNPNSRLEPEELIEIISKYEKADRINKDLVGMLWDRDCVAFYGDPSLAVFLDKENTLKPARTVELKSEGDTWTLVIHVQENMGVSTEWSSPVASYFPRRIKGFELISGGEFNPVITDNFILVEKLENLTAGKSYEIKFKINER